MNDEQLQNLLFERNLINQDELNKAIEETKKLKRPLEKIVVENRLLSKAALYKAIAKHLGFIYLNLEGLNKADEELVKIMPAALALQTLAVPVKIVNGTLQIAMADPADLYSIDQIQMQTGMPLDIALSSPQEINDALNRIYEERSAIADLLSDLHKGGPQTSAKEMMRKAPPLSSLWI